MTAKLAVTVAVDLDATIVTLKPVGRLTPENVRPLLAVVGRAGRILPGFDVHLDLDQLPGRAPGTLRGRGHNNHRAPPKASPSRTPPGSEDRRMSGQIKPERGHRIFHHFGRWALVPDADLLNLRQSLRQVQKLVDPALAGDLLMLVDQEINWRAHTAQWEHTPGPGSE